MTTLPSEPGFIALPTALKEEIEKIIRAAWMDGFDAETLSTRDFFDGFSIAREAMEMPRKVCCECHARLCECDEDTLCRECFDAPVKAANAKRVRQKYPGQTGEWVKIEEPK